MTTTRSIKATLNGEEIQTEVESRLLLSDFLRDGLHLIGTKVGCEHGVCGACSILLDGELIRSCLVFAAQVDGHDVVSFEGLRDIDKVQELTAAMKEHHAVQCGFCTPGMVVATWAYLRDGGAPDPASYREYIAGNLCRCTGYQGLVDAVCSLENRGVAGSKTAP